MTLYDDHANDGRGDYGASKRTTSPEDYAHFVRNSAAPELAADYIRAAQTAAVVAELRRVRRWVDNHNGLQAKCGYQPDLEIPSELTRRIERLTKKGRK